MLCARTQRIKSSAISFKCPFYSVLFFVFFNINFAALASTHLIMIIYHTETHFALAQPWTNWFCLNVFSITLHCACAGAAIAPQWPEEELLLHVIYCVVQTRTYENKNKTHYYLSFCVSLGCPLWRESNGSVCSQQKTHMERINSHMTDFALKRASAMCMCIDYVTRIRLNCKCGRVAYLLQIVLGGPPWHSDACHTIGSMLNCQVQVCVCDMLMSWLVKYDDNNMAIDACVSGNKEEENTKTTRGPETNGI